MDEDAVTEYVDQSRQLIDASPQMDEETTKVRLVQPFLELLGWDLRSTEVELEYTVQIATRTTRVDYALTVGDSPAVFVEAKPVHSELSEENLQQLRSYMRQELAVDWGVLTNGRTFEVLSKQRLDGDNGEVSVVRFDLDRLVENPDVLDLVSKESIRSGRSEEIAEQVTATTLAIRDLRDRENAVTDAVADAVETTVGEVPVDVTEYAETFVSDLVAGLEEQRQFVAEDPTRPADGAEGADESETDDGETSVPDGTDGESSGEPGGEGGTADDGDSDPDGAEEGYVVVFSDGSRIPPDGEDPLIQQKSSMGRAVDYLVEQYDLTDVIEIPYTTPHARKNCLINDTADHPDGRRMRASYELSDGSVLDVNLNVTRKQARIELLAEEVGLSVEFHGEWPDRE